MIWYVLEGTDDTVHEVKLAGVSIVGEGYMHPPHLIRVHRTVKALSARNASLTSRPNTPILRGLFKLSND